MRSKLRARSCFSEQDTRRLAESLSEYALTLPERKKRALCEMLLRAMAPLDRFLCLRTSDFLSADEEAVLHSLEKRSRSRQRPALADLINIDTYLTDLYTYQIMLRVHNGMLLI